MPHSRRAESATYVRPNYTDDSRKSSVSRPPPGFEPGSMGSQPTLRGPPILAARLWFHICLHRRLPSRRVGSTCTSLLAVSVPLAPPAGIAAPAPPLPPPPRPRLVLRYRRESRRPSAASIPHRAGVRRAERRLGEKRGLFVPGRLHVGMSALGEAEPAGLRGAASRASS